MYQIRENETIKCLTSKDYNYVFNKKTGYFARWGACVTDDPECCKFGPEILDLEISTGECLGRCRFCSPAGTKVNTVNGPVNIEDIQEGDFVLGSDNGKIQVQTVKETYSREYSGEIIVIETEDGQQLTVTPEHEVFTINRGFVEAQYLTEDDEIQIL